MVKPVSHSRLLGSLIILALLLGSTTGFAQQAPKPAESDKTESEEAVFIPVEYRAPPWQVSVGVRLAGKAKVKFSGLGAIPNTTSVPGSATASDDYTKTYGRTYDDGSVSPDSTYVFSTLNGTTYTKSEPTDGKTNVWAFTSADQVVDYNGGKALAFHAYAVESDGATTAAEENSSLAWDIEVSRELGSNRRMSWGLLFGAGISDINCKSDATVKAKLRTLTDYYSLDGVTLPTDLSLCYTYSGRSQAYLYTYDDTADPSHLSPLKDTAGNYIYKKDADGNNVIVWTSDPQRLSTEPLADARTDVTETTASLDCIGHWEVKGAYITARFGPYFAYQITRRLAVRASAGLTFTIIGARFRINEQVYIPATKAYMQLTNEDLNLDAKVSGILGYYASCELDAFFTDRTGMFIGASHEDFQHDLSLKYYNQQADIALSTGTVLRTGITTRF